MKNIVDNPEARKLQKAPVPVMGGIAVFFGIVVGLCFYKTMIAYTALFPILAAMTIMLYVGVMDDILNTNSNLRFWIEVVVSLLVLFGLKCRIADFQGMFGIEFIPLWLGIILSAFTFVGIVNAINMIDGVDGLSSAFCVLIMGCLGVMCFITHNFSCAVLAAVCIGALLPFFFHNVFGKSSKMFIGDGGTMMMGTAISSMVFVLLKHNLQYPDIKLENFNMIAYTLSVVAIPVADTLRVIVVRLSHHTSPFIPDQNHMHHILRKYGFSFISITFIELLQAVAVIAFFLLSWILGVSVEWQLFVTIGAAACMNWLSAYVLNKFYDKDCVFSRFVKNTGKKSHSENNKVWNALQRFVDARFADMKKD